MACLCEELHRQHTMIIVYKLIVGKYLA